MSRRRPRWYFSLRSPYSWFAYRDLIERRPEVLDAVDWIPFWEPDARTSEQLAAAKIRLPLVEMSRAKNFYILQDARRLAADRGLDQITWPIDRTPRWEVSHLAYLVAADAGLGPEFVALAYRARWEQAKDISDPAVMGEIGIALGLDPGMLAGAVDDPYLQERGVELLGEAAKDGLFGVPFFVNGHDKFWGVDRVDAFAKSLVAVGSIGPAPTEDLAALLPAGVDAGHAGGCG